VVFGCAAGGNHGSGGLVNDFSYFDNGVGDFEYSEGGNNTINRGGGVNAIKNA
jgi:hypothetical protein